MLEIFIYLQKYVNLERKTQHAVITHANISNGTKPQLFWKKFGDDVELVQCPFNLHHPQTATAGDTSVKYIFLAALIF